MAILILAAIVGILYVKTKPEIGEDYTDFYILGANETATGYPTEIVYGQTANVTVGIANHEKTTETYTVMVTSDNKTLQRTGAVTLADGQTDNLTVQFIPQVKGEGIPFYLDLYKGAGENPYLMLKLVIDVR